MSPMTLIYEIAAIRLRQGRILKILKDISQWNGLIQDDDPEFDALVKQMTERWMKEHRD